MCHNIFVLLAIGYIYVGKSAKERELRLFCLAQNAYKFYLSLNTQYTGTIIVRKQFCFLMLPKIL